MKRINRKKQIENIGALVSVLLLIWFLLSFLDTNIHSHLGDGYGQYHAWNMFYIVFNLMR